MIVRITSRRDGFRRCGIAHSAQPVEYPIDRFSVAELARLQAEPQLMVELLDGGQATAGPADSPTPQGGGSTRRSAKPAARTTPAPDNPEPAQQQTPNGGEE